VTLLDNIECIVASSASERRAVIQAFKKNGITKLSDGRRIENIVLESRWQMEMINVKYLYVSDACAGCDFLPGEKSNAFSIIPIRRREGVGISPGRPMPCGDPNRDSLLLGFGDLALEENCFV
jgi:hypothetical protein